MKIEFINQINASIDSILLYTDSASLTSFNFSKEELNYIEKNIKPGKIFTLNKVNVQFFLLQLENDNSDVQTIEKIRSEGSLICNTLNSSKKSTIQLCDSLNNSDISTALFEGIALTNYTFNKYFTDKSEKTLSLINITILSEVKNQLFEDTLNIAKATNYAKDLVNEPVSFLDAVQFSKEIESLGKEAGFTTQILHKAEIEALKMGGILSVNLGSEIPPTFNIMEWNPSNASNSKPIVLVGKGVVYDTGGLSLKPTANSMDIMKCDMAGGAAVVGAMYAISKNKLPIHVIGLVPASDNRPGKNAYAPGDVITMGNGMTVEIKNTDAEGRLLLADALHYAKKYDPELVIDIATLTGSAMRALGTLSMPFMGTASNNVMNDLKQAGDQVFERMVHFPFWDEYGEEMKSPIADLNNLGGPYAGCITAGKFLEHFTDYPYVHIDIAGPAFLDKPTTYRPAGGTGTGVRLFYQYLKNISK